MPVSYQDRRPPARARPTAQHPVIAQPERRRDCRRICLVGCRPSGAHHAGQFPRVNEASRPRECPLREFVHFRAEHSSLRYRDPVPSRHTIRLQHVDLVSFAAFQIGAFAHVHDEKLRLARSDRSWLDELKQALRKLPADDLFSWQDADLAVSRYHLVNERVGASTLAAQQAKHQLPLRIPARDSSWNESGDLFEWRLESVGLGVDGAACIRHCARLMRDHATVDEVTTSYHILIQDIFRHLIPVARSLLDGLSRADGPLDSVEFFHPDPNRLDTYIASYECLDIDFTATDEHGAPVNLPAKRLITESLDSARQLAALSRMSRIEPDLYDPVKLQKFKDADIGNREDELWIVNSNRMLRSNPDRENRHLIHFYEDILCLVELALQQLAVLGYVDAWLHEARGQFRRQLMSSKSDDADVGRILIDFERVLDLIEQPGGLTAGIRHAFFRQVADRLVQELRIPVALAQAQQAVSMFAQIASAAFTFKVFVSSETTEITVRRLTWIIMIGTLIGAIIAITATILAGG
jgi:hypothetical protein